MKRNRRVIEINYDLCLGCGLCAQVCPTGAITMISGKPGVNPSACVGCGYCFEVCPRGAIRWRELRRRVPQKSFIRHDWPQQHQFVRSQQVSREPTQRTSDLNELKDRIRDLQEKADDIVKRIGRL